jgi:predicted DCC family thiol-disulfide oxidoreductase YuxK
MTKSMRIILFDGICVLCSRTYRFVTTRDAHQKFRFVAIQEPEGRALAQQHGIDPDNPDTFALIDDGALFVRSEAVLRIVSALPGWGWTRVLRVVPRSLRDGVYGIVARNRYRWFGKLDVCMLPPRAGPSA